MNTEKAFDAREHMRKTTLVDLDWLTNEIERGDYISWDRDDYLRLLGALRRAHDVIEANAKSRERRLT